MMGKVFVPIYTKSTHQTNKQNDWKGIQQKKGQEIWIGNL